MNSFCRTALIPSLALSIGLLAGCGGSKSDNGDSRVRLVNATSEYASFDLYQSSSPVTANVASFTGSSYASLGSGTYTFDVRSTSAGTSSSTSSRTVAKDSYNTLVAYTTGGALVTALLTDSESAPSSGAAKFRLFHTAATEAGPVDVYLVGTACTALDSTAAATATNVSTFSSYVEVTAAAAGTPYHVCVTAAGDKTDLRLDIPSVTLTNQQIATLVLTRSSSGVLLHGLVMNQQGTVTAARNTSVRARVAAGAAPVGGGGPGVVSAMANGVNLGSNLASPTIASYRLVPAGALSTTVTIDGTPVPTSGLTAVAGADVTLLVTGTASSPQVALLNDDNTPSTNVAKPVKLRLINALNGSAGGVTLTDDYSVAADNVSFGTASAPTLVASSAALARLEVTYSGTQLFVINNASLAAGKVYTVFLSGPTPATNSFLRADR